MKRFWNSRVFAAVLILAGAGGLFTLFWLLPYQLRDRDVEWLAQHSVQARWEHQQNRIRRSGWRQDDFISVGAYGDERWAEWIMQRLSREDDPAAIFGGHKVSALERITNFAPDRKLKPWREVLPLWQAWWKENGAKTQKEWIVDGFAAAGVAIHNPPVEEDWPALLTVLAGWDSKPDGSNGTGNIQRKSTPLNYNAFRCLRDSGFNSVKYALEAKLTPEIRAGLMFYHRWETAGDMWSERPGVVFAKGHEVDWSDAMPEALKPAFRWGWGSGSSVVLLAGLWMWGRRRGFYGGC